MTKDEISRRDFIKGIGAGAAGLVVMGALGGCASGAETSEGTTTAAQTTAAAAS